MCKFHLASFSEYAVRHGRRDRLASLLVLICLQVIFHAQVRAANLHSELWKLNALSQRLVATLRAGTAEAASFRTDVVYYREGLRNVMLKNEKSHQAAKSLLMDMVRMAALLQSAAECHTGRYITCPANLMQELEGQQKHLNAMLPKETSGS